MKFQSNPAAQASKASTSAPAARRTNADIKGTAELNANAFAKQEEPLEADFVRVPFGNHNAQLVSTKIPGHHLHWINDWHPQMTDRLQQALRAGYRYVSPEEVDTYPASNGGNPNADLGGTRVSRIVGTRPDGQPITAYLMKIPEQWWMEHQKPIAERADAVDKAIRRGVVAGPVEQGYIPKGDPIRIKQVLEQRNSTEGDMNG